jgi:hypothetical protein
MLPFEEPDIPEEEEDIDPFAELEIGSHKTVGQSADPLAAFTDEDDPLAAFEEDNVFSSFEEEDTPVEDIVISFDEESVPDLDNKSTPVANKAESTYKLLLETVWVDDILDPSEVELLSRKRRELGLTFERHLQLVRDIIEG